MKTTEGKRAARQLRDEHDPGRYTRLSRRVWQDRRFKALSGPPPNARYLWLYLLTNQHLTRIPGLFPVRLSTIAEELGWSPEGLGEPFREVFEQELIQADWKAGLVWLPNAVKHDPPGNPNVVLGWLEVVAHHLPESPLLGLALAGIRSKLQEVMSNPAPYLAAFDTVFTERFLQRLGEPFPEGLGESGFWKLDPGSWIHTAAPADAVAVSAPPPQTQLALEVTEAKPPDLDAEVYAHWRTLFAPRATEVLDPDRRRLIAKRRAERSKDAAGNPRDLAAVQRELLDSLSGWKNDPWVGRSRNSRLSQLMGNAGDVDQGLRFFADGPPRPGAETRGNRQPGGYASLEEIEAQDFTVDPVEPPRVES